MTSSTQRLPQHISPEMGRSVFPRQQQERSSSFSGSSNNSPLRLVSASLLFLLVIAQLPSLVQSAPLGSLSVAFDVRPGHVIGQLDWRGSGQRSLVVEPAALSKHFTVMQQQGVLVTSQRIDELAGWLVPLTVQHKSPTGQTWTEKVKVYVEHGSEAVAFVNQPYVGYVDENLPPNTEISGLDNLRAAVEKFPYGCFVSVQGGDQEYFSVKYSTGDNFKLVSRMMFDREVHPTYYVYLSAKCPGNKEVGAYVRIDIADINDNKPFFEQESYNVVLSSAPKPTDSIVQVSAIDMDYGNQIQYSIEDDAADLFRIDPNFGTVTVAHPHELRPMTYEFKVIAIDQAGHRSPPANVRVQGPFAEEDGGEAPMLLRVVERFRRAVRDPREFVVDRNWEGDLFYVADTENPVAEERYSFMDIDQPEGLEMNSLDGLVSRGVGHAWNASVDMFEFTVNVTRTDNPDCKYKRLLTDVVFP